MKSNTKKLTVLIVLGMGFVCLPNVKLDFDNVQKTNVIKPKRSGGYNEPFIHVDGSIPGNWSGTALKVWCSGDGSWSNPYTIENVTIDASGSPTGSGIIINNSKDEYFIIRNCTVYNVRNEAYNGGIKLENSNNGTLTINNCSNNLRNGIILLNNCKNNTISGNTANGNKDNAIVLAYCHYNNITGNTINNNPENGITLVNSSNNIIAGNTEKYNEVGIILVDSSDNNTITGNIANFNLCGL